MMTLRNRRAKKIEVNLNFLRNDLDNWNHRVISWLDAKSQPQQNEIEKFGIEVVQKLCTREILKKKDIYGMKFPERPLTPRRSGSASPNRPTTPDSASSGLKSITRDSPKDRHHDCQKKLDLDDDEDGYKVNAYNATCTCAHDETLYQCRISVLEKQKIKIEKELQRFESLANEYIVKFRDLKKTMDSREIDACPDCKMKEQHMQRYKAERNELKIDGQRLEKLLTNLAGERNDLEQKLQKIVFDNAKLEDKNQNLESRSSPVEGRPDTENENIRLRCELTEALENNKNKTRICWSFQKEKANQYSAYEVLQNKNDLETCKHQKKALEDERNELQKENNELENELQSLNSKLEQFDDSARYIFNLEKHIKDLEEGYRNAGTNVHEVKEKMQKLEEAVQEQKQKNRDLIVKLENLNKEKKDLEDRLRVIGSHYKEELGQKKEEIDKMQRDKEKYMFSKDETCEMSSFKKDNAELKQKLKNLSTQLNESENRLEINNYEKSSLIKKIKELKNILQEKLSEIQRLETRLQKYAEQFEDIQVQKRHMDNLQSDNDELNQKCTNLQTVEKNVQKLKKEKQQLETEMISQRRKNETLNSRVKILYDEKLDNEDKLRRYITTDQKAKNDIKQLQTAIQDLKEENWEYIFQGNKFKEEKTELENKLRLHDNEVRLLYNSLDTERHEHDAAMKRLEMQYTAVQNECVELWLKLQNIHNSSEISFEKLGSVIDKNIFKQKLEETTAHENTLAKETTKILKNFASAKDKKGCIKVLQKRFEKDHPSCDNDISSDEKTDMEDNISNGSYKKYYDETLMESRATTICHSRMNRTTNVYNVNIASSKVSINENTAEQFACIDGNNGQYPAIDEGQ